MMYKAILEGSSFSLTTKEVSYLENILHIKIAVKSLKVDVVFKEVMRILRSLYKYDGPCSKYMLEKPIISSGLCCGLKV